MAKTVIIIHRSAIIRSGLRSILKEQNTGIDILDFSCWDELALTEPQAGDLFLIYRENETKTSSKINPSYLFNEIFILPCTDSNLNTQNSININTDPEEIRLPLLQLKDTPTKDNDSSDPNLSVREKEVLTQVAMGQTNKEIADTLNISIHTVISHRKNITQKLGIKSISGLTVYAFLNNLIDTNNIDIASLI